MTTVTLKGGPLDGDYVPVTGGRVNHGFLIQLPFTERVTRADRLNDWHELRERYAIYKAQGNDCGDGEATFVGVLR